MTLPFARLGLHRNPFGALTDREQAELAVVDIDGLASWLRGGRRALQLLDLPGRGKTTHLLALQDRCNGAVMIRPLRGVQQPPDGALAVVDDVQLLPVWRRLRLWMRRGSVALSTHRDLSAELRWCGYEVRTVRPSTSWSLDRLRCVVSDRVMACREGPQGDTVVDDALLQRVYRRSGTDVRGAMEILYDHCQARETTQRG